ncbi:MAG TPA: ferrous iron transport protein A [Anaeromyxobacter sp.]
MDLSKLEPGQSGRITSLGALGAVRRRLMDMGVLVGERVTVAKVAPLGDPIEVRIRSYSLSLRKSEAEAIGVEVSP